MPRYNDYDYSLLASVTIVRPDSPPSHIYHGDKPLTVEIGCGNGHFLTSQALDNPENAFCGIDMKSERIIRCMQKVRRDNLANIFFVVGDAFFVLQKCFADAQINRIFMTFPDPWPKKRHHKKRLFRPDFLDIVADKLAAGGAFIFITDFAPYFEWSRDIVCRDDRFTVTFLSDNIENMQDKDYLTNSLFGQRWKQQDKTFCLLEFIKK